MLRQSSPKMRFDTRLWLRWNHPEGYNRSIQWNFRRGIFCRRRRTTPRKKNGLKV